MDIGLKIRELLNKKSISIEKLGSLLQINRQSVYNITNNRVPITVERLQKIADVLEVPITYFFDANESCEECEELRKTNKILSELLDRFFKLNGGEMRQFVIFIADFCRNESNFKLLQSAYKKYLDKEYKQWVTLGVDTKRLPSDLKNKLNTLASDSQSLDELVIKYGELLGEEFMATRKPLKRIIKII